MGNSALGQQIGLRIRELRTERKWSQKMLADKLHINKSVISYYELGERFPSYDVMIHLSEVFHVSIDYLVKGEQERQMSVAGLTNDEYNAVASIVEALQNKNIQQKE